MAVKYSGGVWTSLGMIAGGTASSACAVNDKGQIVGYCTSSTPQHAFLYDNGLMKDIGTLGGLWRTRMLSMTPGRWQGTLR